MQNQEHMKTVFYLLAQFNKVLIPLAEISEDYLNCTPQTAARKAGSGLLPLPTLPLGGGDKRGQRVVYVEDLAEYLNNL